MSAARKRETERRGESPCDKKKKRGVIRAMKKPYDFWEKGRGKPPRGERGAPPPAGGGRKSLPVAI